MTFVSVDVEADGPIPGDYSMISFGAVIVDEDMGKTFYGQLAPISKKWDPEALAVSGHTREECFEFRDPVVVMQNFETWLEQIKRPMFIADNNGFDWQFINWYFHHFLGRNPFGFSSTNLNSIWKGMQKDCFSSFKHLRKTKHSHHPVDDARGNAEALLAMQEMGLKFSKRNK